jgi:hypothetical protein
MVEEQIAIFTAIHLKPDEGRGRVSRSSSRR